MGQDFDFYGYAGHKFGENMVVEPRAAAAGKPWVLRARFWGHEPQTDTALLAAGFHITYCDVADMYGSPSAVAKYDDFYKEMTGTWGLSAKVVLEGMSRGGLIVYNWAARNADKVAAIYADAPVMDIKSWPIKSSDEDTKKMLAAYGFASLEQAMAWGGNPVDNAAALVGIPIIHVVGSADHVVPVAENTDLFKTRYQAAGGFMTVIRKAGVGHHPHSLKDPATIVNFILSAIGMQANVCTTPLAGQEWRQGAGWVDGADWWANHAEISELLQNPTDIILLGNSITQGFGGNRKAVTYKPGLAALNGALAGKTWVAAGISGDKTQNLLWRLENGGYAAANARTVFITIGVNNLYAGDNTADVAVGIVKIATRAAELMPNAKIVVFGTLPFYDMKAQSQVQAVLAGVVWGETAGKKIIFVDPTDRFTDKGKLIEKYYSDDKLHLSQSGYTIFAELIAANL